VKQIPILILVLMAGCGSQPESRQDYNLAVPLLLQKETERTFRDVDFERVARLEPPDSLLYPGGTQLLAEGVFLLEYTNKTVWRYDFDGRLVTTYGHGSGVGPGEMQNPIGLSVVEDTVLILDSTSRKVHRFTLDGMFLRSDQLPVQGIRIATSAGTTLIHTFDSEEPFILYPVRESRPIGPFFDGLGRLEGMKISGWLAADHGRFVYVHNWLPFFGVLTADNHFDLFDYARATIDESTFIEPSLPEAQNGFRRFPPALNVHPSVTGDFLYMHSRIEDTDSSRVVDVYDLEAMGVYAYSFRIPFAARSMSFRGEMMSALTGPTTAALFRVRVRN